MSRSSIFLRIIDFMEKHKIKKFNINDDLTVDVDGSVILHNDDLIDGKIPIQFGKVTEHFSCAYSSSLSSLEGSPYWVGGYYSCRKCPNLTSLQGAPEYVEKIFWCDHCPNLRSLEEAPKYIGGDVACYDCPNLKSLKGLKKVKGEIYGDFFKGYLKDYKGEL